MRIRIDGLGRLGAGVREVAPVLGLEIGDDGVDVRAVQWARDELHVERRADVVEIRFSQRTHFFRGLGLAAERLGSGTDFQLDEKVAFRSIGPMIDVAQGNAVPRVPVVRRILRSMALMGLNLLLLYSEDSYEIEGRPFFGYMRGRYTPEALREIDDYADMLGIEVVPCIQTLGHLFEALKWAPFKPIRDDPHTLLVGDERSYQLIEDMILSGSRPVRSRRIHLGMDEAWNLGRGRYLTLNGHRPKIEIFSEHLARVMEIVNRHGLEPLIWSDMFFRATSPSNAYDRGGAMSDVARAAVPDGVSLVYWSYHDDDPAFYRRWLEHHIELGKGRMPVFAGGISNWRGWGPNYGMTFAATNAALTACKEVGVQEVLATLWGDDGTECDLSAALLGLQLYAEHCYGDDVGEEHLARRFRTCCRGEAADFMMLKRVDEVPSVEKDNPMSRNPSQYLLWQNPLLGLFDANVTQCPGLGAHYDALGREIEGAIARNPEHADMLTLYRKLCAALAIKSELGVQLTEAYRGGDRARLRELAEVVVPKVTEAVRDLHACHRGRWHDLYLAFGWEVMDARYGAALLALEDASWRIGRYLESHVPALEELEEHRLPFDGEDGLPQVWYVGRMQSASRLVWYEG